MFEFVKSLHPDFLQIKFCFKNKFFLGQNWESHNPDARYGIENKQISI
jgi:hypothetical protein